MFVHIFHFCKNKYYDNCANFLTFDTKYINSCANYNMTIILIDYYIIYKTHDKIFVDNSKPRCKMYNLCYKLLITKR